MQQMSVILNKLYYSNQKNTIVFGFFEQNISHNLLQVHLLYYWIFYHNNEIHFFQFIAAQ